MKTTCIVAVLATSFATACAAQPVITNPAAGPAKTKQFIPVDGNGASNYSVIGVVVQPLSTNGYFGQAPTNIIDDLWFGQAAIGLPNGSCGEQFRIFVIGDPNPPVTETPLSGLPSGGDLGSPVVVTKQCQ